MVHYIWMEKEPFSHYNLTNLHDGPILPSTHIFPKTIFLDLDPPSLNTYINETFQDLKFESNNLVPSKIEQNSMDVCNTQDLSNIHGEA